MGKLSILLKLLPAIKDALFGGLKLSFYLKRNKVITMLCIALTLTAFGCFYFFEQAVMHGYMSKKLSEQTCAPAIVNTNK